VEECDESQARQILTTKLLLKEKHFAGFVGAQGPYYLI
jgi:hypothetical protein